MTPEDASKVLLMAQVYDNRSFDEHTARGWAEVLDGLELGDCLDAVKLHFRRSKAWLMPSDVREIVRGLLFERRQQVPAIEAPQTPEDRVAERVAMVRAAAEAAFKIPEGPSPHPKQDPGRDRKARKVACPWCKAPAKSSCVNTATGQPSVTHEARLIAAGILEPAS